MFQNTVAYLPWNESGMHVNTWYHGFVDQSAREMMGYEETQTKLASKRKMRPDNIRKVTITV